MDEQIIGAEQEASKTSLQEFIIQTIGAEQEASKTSLQEFIISFGV